MNVYKVTFTYQGRNMFLRTGTLIIDAPTPERAEEICAAQLAEHSGTTYRHAKVNKAVLYGEQHELDVTTAQPKPKAHK